MKKLNRLIQVLGQTARPVTLGDRRLHGRVEKVVRQVLMVGSAFAALLFTFIIVLICIKAVHEHILAGVWYVLPLFGTIAGFAFYISQNLWRESHSSSPQRVIINLRAHELSSIEFYEVAGDYFRRRLQVIQMCGLFFFLMALLFVVLVFVSQVPWWFDIVSGVLSVVCAVIGRTPYRIGKYGILMIETAREAGTEHRLNALYQLATRSFRSDPVGSCVLEQFADDKPAY